MEILLGASMGIAIAFVLAIGLIGFFIGLLVGLYYLWQVIGIVLSIPAYIPYVGRLFAVIAMLWRALPFPPLLLILTFMYGSTLLLIGWKDTWWRYKASVKLIWREYISYWAYLTTPFSELDPKLQAAEAT